MKKSNLLTIGLIILYFIATIYFKEQRVIPTVIFILAVISLPLGPRLFKENRSEDSKGFLEQMKRTRNKENKD